MKKQDQLIGDENSSRGALQFTRAIREAREFMFSRAWITESPDPLQEKAAAEQQLKHQISAALDQGFVFHDPFYPEFRELNQHNQYGLYNPDNRYQIATISTPGRYVIRGKRGSSADLQVQVGAGEPGFEEGLTNLKHISQLALSDLVCEDDGSFEIIISDTREGVNWLNNTEGELKATSILIRESFMDWQSERSGTWYIERTDRRGTPSVIPDSELTNRQYERASRYLVQSTKNWVNAVEGIECQVSPNILTPPKLTGGGGLTGQWQSIGIFPLDASQAVIVTLSKSCARYQSMQVGDMWFSALDYCRRQISLNVEQASPSSDGRYRLVISREDPGVANWLDPAGASTVFAFLRWQGLPKKHSFSPDEQPRAKVVDFDQLRKCLPTDEPHFSPADRVEQLAARQAASLQSPRGF